MNQFTKLYFPQIRKKALIVDVRGNGGGFVSPLVIERLRRALVMVEIARNGMPQTNPPQTFVGPMVALIDEFSASDGDIFPFRFKAMGLVKLIGKRTWGGLIGISANPGLIDGGNLTVPYFRFFTPEREWRIENEGTAPDIDVELNPIEVNRGRDTQLDAALQSVMQRLQSEKPTARGVPPAMPTQLGK